MLQKAIMAVYAWAVLNKIPLNPLKTLHLPVGKNRFCYYLNDVRIPTVEKAIDLGIVYDDRLSFKHQENNIILKSKQMIEAGRKFYRTYRNKHLLLRLFKTYYMPKIGCAKLGKRLKGSKEENGIRAKSRNTSSF